MDVDKAKARRKFYVGQELEFRRDNMEVSFCAHSLIIIILSTIIS